MWLLAAIAVVLTALTLLWPRPTGGPTPQGPMGGSAPQITTGESEGTAAGYQSAVEELMLVLAKARADLGGVQLLGDVGLSRALAFSAEVLNETALSINGSVYRYAIVRARGPGLEFEPREVEAGGISVAALPAEGTATYTGGRPYRYSIRYGGREHNITLWDIPFTAAGFKATVNTGEVGGGLYWAEITAGSEEIWLVLGR